MKIGSPSRRGFTLVEAITTMVVLAIIGSVTSGMLLSGVTGYRDAATSAQIHAEASAALDRIVRELREVPLDAGAPDIESVTSNSITWATNSSLTVSGSKLRLSIAGGTAQTLLDSVSSFSVQTYNESNTALSASLSGAGCAPIRRVQLQVTVTRQGVSQTLRTRVFLRRAMEGSL